MLSRLSLLSPYCGTNTLSRRFQICRRFGWKYADFIIFRPYTLDVLAVIELDDCTHDVRNDRQRDAITKAAGFQPCAFSPNTSPA